MQQYGQMKAQYPDAILFFRVGDFYETFGQDAVKVSNILGIVLTSRNNGGSDIELAGFPYHSLDLYLPKVVKAGFRVAICEQLEKPSKEKKIVKRGVTNVVTPGVTLNDNLLDHKQNNFLAAIHFNSTDHHGIAFLDISTGEFLISEGRLNEIEKLVQSLQPSEIIYSRSYQKKYIESFAEKYHTFLLDEWIFSKDFTREKLCEQFEVANLKGFGVEHLESAQIAGGAALHYLSTTQNDRIKHINQITRIESDNFVWLDRFTIRNLELVGSNHHNGLSLLQILDHTISPMGARLLRKWLLLPLKNLLEINRRHEIVEKFHNEEDFREDFKTQLKSIGDLERLIAKIATGKVNPREIIQLKKALEALGPIKELLLKADNKHLEILGDKIQLCEQLHALITKQLVEEPPTLLSKGYVIADGFDDELDELRNIVANSKDLLLEIQQVEAEKTGITNLKIGFNNVFGYYLEVTNKYKNQGLIPDNWVRKQTLTGSERYITDELKKLESKILGAEDKISGIEERLYLELVTALQAYISPIQANAEILAELDCLYSFAHLAVKHNYAKPEVNDSLIIDIKEGRHPVIEQQLELGEAFVPNDTYLDSDDQQIIMITGPNMSGKSAVLRQTALICLLAQIGSFVPATSAKIGYIDKLFTRVGASDNISSGESTFMVEMNETASIMNNISERSLILLDEIGRGTSTYDGISIAWALTEYLHEHSDYHAKTLFATHYHELNELANRFPRIRNFNVTTKELGHKVIFLRKLVEGGSKHSFGIHVAKMAGMPNSIVGRAVEILKQLEDKAISSDADSKIQNITDSSHLQLSIFETTDETAGKLKKELLEVDINGMTPIDCMMKLQALKKLVEEGK